MPPIHRPDPLRVAALCAFQFPAPQGSQVFAGQQALALRRAGLDVELFCYGRGAGDPPPALPLQRAPAWSTPRSYRAGPKLRKPLADLALGWMLLRAHRRRAFDVVLAHNAEAALLALALRARTGIPCVYVAHTLLGVELRCYAPARLGGTADRLGAQLDQQLARHSDAVLALSENARKALLPHTDRPVVQIPPGLDPGPAPHQDAVREMSRRHGLSPGGFALYAGNLDAYQDLASLQQAAAQLRGLPVVVATHGPPRRLDPLRVLRVPDAESVRTLSFGAALAVAPRRHVGGFPIKLLNYMEASLPIVARAEQDLGLTHDRDAWLVAPHASPTDFAHALRTLFADPERARRLGRAGRAHLEGHHHWPDLAARTHALLREVCNAPQHPRVPRESG
ncbi:MAG: glycosyltransferase family 4 protein [Myxococcota bacterium]